MKTYNEKVGNKLNEILEKTYDAEEGFKKAASKANSANLKQYFKTKSEQRTHFKNELKAEVTSFGQKFDDSGSATAAAHRTWMDVKSLFSSDDDEAMLEESLKGEKAALDEYEEVLNETTLPESTRNLLSKQRTQIQSGISTIKSLEDLKS